MSRRPSSRYAALMRLCCSAGTRCHSRTMSGPWLAAKAPTRRAQVEAALAEALLHQRIVEDGVDLAIELRHDALGRAARRDDAEPGGELEARQARFGRGGNLGPCREPFGLRYREHFHRALRAHHAQA